MKKIYFLILIIPLFFVALHLNRAEESGSELEDIQEEREISELFSEAEDIFELEEEVNSINSDVFSNRYYHLENKFFIVRDYFYAETFSEEELREYLIDLIDKRKNLEEDIKKR